MPYGDGTGPGGMGPMTGRAAGYCAGYPVPGFQNPMPGRGAFGRGIGRGGGRGWRNMNYATGLPGGARYNMSYPALGAGVPNIPYSYTPPQITPEQEIDTLKNQAKYMQDDMNAINDRIKELENLSAEKNKPKK